MRAGVLAAGIAVAGVVVAGCNQGEAPHGDATTVVASPSSILTPVPTAAAEATPTSTVSVPGACVPVSPRSLGVGWEPFCVTWLDRFSDETGFVIRLTYYGSGETFEHTVGPNATEFVFPPAEGPFGGAQSCGSRGAFDVALSVVRAGKVEEFDRIFRQGHCGDGSQ